MVKTLALPSDKLAFAKEISALSTVPLKIILEPSLLSPLKTSFPPFALILPSNEALPPFTVLTFTMFPAPISRAVPAPLKVKLPLSATKFKSLVVAIPMPEPYSKVEFLIFPIVLVLFNAVPEATLKDELSISLIVPALFTEAAAVTFFTISMVAPATFSIVSVAVSNLLSVKLLIVPEL